MDMLVHLDVNSAEASFAADKAVLAQSFGLAAYVVLLPNLAQPGKSNFEHVYLKCSLWAAWLLRLVLPLPEGPAPAAAAAAAAIDDG